MLNSVNLSFKLLKKSKFCPSSSLTHINKVRDSFLALNTQNFSTTTNGDGSSAKESKITTIPAASRYIKKKIFVMDPSEYEDTAVCLPKQPLLHRRGESGSMFEHLRLKKEDIPGRNVDIMSFVRQKIDLSPSNLKRIYAAYKKEVDIERQKYNPKRVEVLGRDLGFAHFVVARKGRVKFMGHDDWVTQYYKDKPTRPVQDELQPLTKQMFCNLPVFYDPDYRLEAIDASGVLIRYEGLSNLDGLNYVKWASFRDNPVFNDWCIDRLCCNISETVEYLDISGCRGVTATGISSLWRLKNLKTLVLNNMSHVKDLEVLCATLEDELPGLTCIGIDFESKLNQMRLQAEEIRQQKLLENEELERRTIEVTPQTLHGLTQQTFKSNQPQQNR